jgi:CubicO group peptidase (beta-lactamase class C family)
MTKTWTALAFMQLVDEGRVDLDEPVRTYLPGFTVADPKVSAEVTPRQLLFHTNGIEEAYGDPGEDDDVYERMVGNIADAPQVFPLVTLTVTARRWVTRFSRGSWRCTTANRGTTSCGSASSTRWA